MAGLPRGDFWIMAGDFNIDKRRHAALLAEFIGQLTTTIAPQALHAFCPDEYTINAAAPFTTSWHLDEGVDHFYRLGALPVPCPQTAG